jgi:ABC-type microcin C transport system permease subunit YejB
MGEIAFWWYDDRAAPARRGRLATGDGEPMGAYILRRLLLMIPTLFGIMIVNFALVQFVPGGPIEQIIAQMEGRGDSTASRRRRARMAAAAAISSYRGAQGLPPEFIAQLERSSASTSRRSSGSC